MHNIFKLTTNLEWWEVEDIFRNGKIPSGQKLHGKDILKHFDYKIEEDNELERELAEAVGKLIKVQLDEFKSSLRSL